MRASAAERTSLFRMFEFPVNNFVDIFLFVSSNEINLSNRFFYDILIEWQFENKCEQWIFDIFQFHVYVYYTLCFVYVVCVTDNQLAMIVAVVFLGTFRLSIFIIFIRFFLPSFCKFLSLFFFWKFK